MLAASSASDNAIDIKVHRHIGILEGEKTKWVELLSRTGEDIAGRSEHGMGRPRLRWSRVLVRALVRRRLKVCKLVWMAHLQTPVCGEDRFPFLKGFNRERRQDEGVAAKEAWIGG